MVERRDADLDPVGLGHGVRLWNCREGAVKKRRKTLRGKQEVHKKKGETAATAKEGQKQVREKASLGEG